GVSPQLQRRFDMVDGRLAALHIQRARLKKYIGLGVLQPFTHVAGEHPMVRRRPTPTQYRQRVQSVRIGKPAVAPGGHAGESPAHVITPPNFRFFRDKQAQKCLAHISEPYDSQVVRGDMSSSARVRLRRRSFRKRCEAYFTAALSFAAAEEISAASSCSTRATTTMPSSACFHSFCSMASRTAGTVFTAYPV